MKSKLSLLALIVALTSAAQAAVYVEGRASYLSMIDTPEAGDLGVETSSDTPDFVPSLAVGFTLGSRVSLEARYSHIDDITISKTSSTWNVFPGGEVILPAQRHYEFEQKTELFSVALPVKLVTNDRFSLAVAPVAHIEKVDLFIHETFRIDPAAAQLTLPPEIFLNREETEIRPGVEVAFNWRLSARAHVSLNYAFASLKTYDAHLLGAGLGITF